MSRMSSRVHPVAVDLGGGEVGEDVVGRVGLTLVELGVEVLVDAVGRWRSSRRSGSSDRSPASGSIFSGCRMPSRSPSSVSSSSHGSPISPRKTADGNSSANSSVKLHSPRSTNASMNRSARSVMSSSMASMRLGGEQRVEDLAVLRVHRRVDVERDQRPDVAERHVDRRREQLMMAQHIVGEIAFERIGNAGYGAQQAALLDQVDVVLLRTRHMDGVGHLCALVQHRPHPGRQLHQVDIHRDPSHLTTVSSMTVRRGRRRSVTQRRDEGKNGAGSVSRSPGKSCSMVAGSDSWAHGGS